MNPSDPIKTIMTSNVITVQPDETLESVKNKLTAHNIHHLPVVEGSNVVGMVSHSEVLHMEHHFTLFQNPIAEESNQQLFSTILAKEIMTTPVVLIRVDEPISKAVDLFLENRFHALPVVDNNDQLVGMVSPVDLIRYAFKHK